MTEPNAPKMRALELAAPLKINLTLHICGRRADGFHDLESLVVFAPAGDTLRLAAAQTDSFSAQGDYASAMGAEAENLAVRARAALRAWLGAESVPPAALHLRKIVPVAAGLGGGSADAAACLFGLCRLNGLPLGEPEFRRALLALAAELGADVPMCLAWFFDKTAFAARGKGETLSALPHFPALPLVVVNDGAKLPTAAVFARFAALPAAKRAQLSAPLPPALEQGGFAALPALLRQAGNALYAPAAQLSPAPAALIAALEAEGALFAAMSGSGSSCFGLYESQAAAEAAAKALRRRARFSLAVMTDGAPPKAA